MSVMPSLSPTISPTSYELSLRVQEHDIDRQGHVNNVVYLQWVQDVAIEHWATIASPEEQAEVIWVVLRHEIDYKAASRLGDEVLVRTWFGTSQGLTFERLTEITRADGQLLAKARTLWCPTNPQTGRPMRISPQIRALFSGRALQIQTVD